MWPFNGSYNEALICVFDGHGLHGEKVSEYCVHKVTEMLALDEEALASDPAKHMFEVRTHARARAHTRAPTHAAAPFSPPLLASPRRRPFARWTGSCSAAPT